MAKVKEVFHLFAWTPASEFLVIGIITVINGSLNLVIEKNLFYLFYLININIL